MSLDFRRDELWKCLTHVSHYEWDQVGTRIEAWWMAYKEWERQDTFEAAFRENRMAVRTFDSGFDKQYIKSAGLDRALNLDDDRYFADGRYEKSLEGSALARAKGRFKFETNASLGGFAGATWPEHARLPGGYWANRSIDSSPFLKPENFATRDSKYDWGLHDLSASLLDSQYPIFDQIHNSGDGAHFSFMPMARQEDQATIYSLIRLAKAVEPEWPMYALIRGYRARMTRIKLAQNFDMGTGFVAIPTAPTPGGRRFKIRYGLVSQVTVPGDVDKSGKVAVTPKVYEARQQAAFNFRDILSRQGKNEIIIALRQHEGNFPLAAERQGEVLRCYDIVGGRQRFNGHTISARGAYS